MPRETKRTYRELTAAEQQRLAKSRKAVARELPELMRRDQLAQDAAREQSFSGELRRAIHQSRLTLIELADQTGATPLILDEFLTGEGTLQSDVIDRLVVILGFRLTRTT